MAEYHQWNAQTAHGSVTNEGLTAAISADASFQRANKAACAEMKSLGVALSANDSEAAAWPTFGGSKWTGAAASLHDIAGRIDKAFTDFYGATGGGDKMCEFREMRKRWDAWKAEREALEQKREEAIKAREANKGDAGNMTEADPDKVSAPACDAPEKKREAPDEVQQGWEQANELEFDFMGEKTKVGMLQKNPKITREWTIATYPKDEKDQKKTFGPKFLPHASGAGLKVGAEVGAKVAIKTSLSLEAKQAKEGTAPFIDINVGGGIGVSGETFGSVKLLECAGVEDFNVGIGAKLDGKVALGGKVGVTGGMRWTPNCGWTGRIASGATFESKISVEPSVVSEWKFLDYEKELFAFKIGEYTLAGTKLEVGENHAISSKGSEQIGTGEAFSVDNVAFPSLQDIDAMKDEWARKLAHKYVPGAKSIDPDLREERFIEKDVPGDPQRKREMRKQFNGIKRGG